MLNDPMNPIHVSYYPESNVENDTGALAKVFA